MNKNRQFFYYIFVLVIVIFTLSSISTYLFYTTAIEQQRKNLLLSVTKDIKIIKEKHDIKKINKENIHVWNKNFYLINKKDCYLKTKKYYLVKKEKNKLEVLYPQYKQIESKKHFLLKALIHPTGAQKTIDEEQNKILMAYKLFSGTAIYLVEKIQLEEVIEPYIPTFIIIFISSFIFLIMGVILFTQFNKNIISKQKEIEKLSSQIIQIREDEKENISQEIHDSIGTSLFLLKMMLQSFYSKRKDLLLKSTKGKKDYTDILDYINTIVSQTRELSHNLSPISLKKLGLQTAIEQLSITIEKNSDIKISLQIDEINHFFKSNWDINLYRIIQESLLNITKHAKASQLSIITKIEENQLIISIIDNGVGFDTSKLKFQSGLGIMLLKERSKAMNANIEIYSEKNKGTEVKIEIKK